MEKRLPTLTEKDWKEMEEEKRRNSEQRMAFVEHYAEWLKKTPNKVWSKQHAKFLGKK
ncbi:MAG: hypothetical protein Q8P05_04320 [Candidatus Diapherotrites archaeon]|nr:hypothetical protein [Candidatus Diapherotrites archaeon]MDZ4256845.1 hypothetical protein [archaeon]